MQKKIEYQRSDFVEQYFMLDPGLPFNLKKYPFFRALYNTPKTVVLAKCSRQVGKSVTLVVKPGQQILQAEMDIAWLRAQKIPKSKMSEYNIRPRAVLTVMPLDGQAKKFSEQKLSMIINNSPIFKNFISKNTANKVMTKTFVGGSSYSLASCFRSADGIRGQTTDDVNLDEIQDLDLRFIPVIFETQSRSPAPTRLLSGTSKTTNNTIEYYWKESRQCEWMVPCYGCNHWNLLGIKNIGLTGIICSKCGKPIISLTGRWVAMNKNGSIDGYRIHSLMADFYPWTAPRGSDMWPFTLMYKMETYTEGKFFNEVLGMPYDTGKKPVTEEEIKACCLPETRRSMRIETGFVPATKNPHYKMFVAAGVDWGTSLEGNAKTVLNIEGYLNGKFVTLFAKKYGPKESDPDYQVQDIISWCKAYNVSIIGVDEGFGHGKNEEIAKHFGEEHIRGNSDMVMKFSNSGNLKKRREWNAKGMFYSVNRTEIMTDLFSNIKKGNICFPEWKVFGEFAEDILCITTEFNESTNRMHYTHSPVEPDDYCFALLYSMEAIMVKLNMDKIR